MRSDRVIVLNNGMLLGGLFTMAGGIGLSVAGGEGVARFLVLSAALAITVVLGYLRFYAYSSLRSRSMAVVWSSGAGGGG